MGVSTLSPATREPSNIASLRVAAARLCQKVHLADCRTNVALEAFGWREQMLMVLRTSILIAYHGSGPGAASLWMPARATVVEFQPSGCWWCAFAIGTAALNCSAVGTGPKRNSSPRLVWLLSTTACAPVAQPVTREHYLGCVGGGAAEFVARRDKSRRVGYRSLRALGVALAPGVSFRI